MLGHQEDGPMTRSQTTRMRMIEAGDSKEDEEQKDRATMQRPDRTRSPNEDIRARGKAALTQGEEATTQEDGDFFF